MQPIIVISAYNYISPSLLECHKNAIVQGKPLVAACLSDSWFERLYQRAAFPEVDRASLAQSLPGVEQVHLVSSNADINAMKQHYGTSDIAVIDAPAFGTLTSPRRLEECALVSLHLPSCYQLSPA